MKIEILGTGCAKCEALAASVEEAAKNLGVDYQLHKITDLSEIMKRGVMILPALAIDGEVKLSGQIASVEELSTLLLTAMAQLDKS